jgi:hypothetical protein
VQKAILHLKCCRAVSPHEFGPTLAAMLRGHGKTGWAIVSAVGSVILGTLLADHYWWAWVPVGLLGTFALFLIISDWRGKGGHPMSKQDPQPPSSGGHQFISVTHNQQGGIGQRVNIQQTEPTFAVEPLKQNEPDGDRLLTAWRVHLRQQQAAVAFKIQVDAEPLSIVHFKMNALSASQSTWNELDPDGPGPWTTVGRGWHSPLASAYDVAVWTEESAPLTIRAGFVAS